MATRDGSAFTKFTTRIGYSKHAHVSLDSDVHGMEKVTQNALGGTTNTDWGGQCDITCVILSHVGFRIETCHGLCLREHTH